ncbi:uncharacterized protein TRAVEDRAFT_43872 [Trametes versicolor FP-101664 SS1]|uniref:uncharacterized protein n=1 Tax=Trametes versicolor (strain FP-101664) TaxID=717944 RepID=UPI00046239D7|nr:uncharacterized protein TRAVEDRAFT_43872 [Trametes versicolor FP-101664 SS1]EIW63585.1 hypothetical protein TRAVEDRAFT_43872 [Trametes versicolor FP-101664 SS1]
MFARTLVDFPASAALVKRLCAHIGEPGAECWLDEQEAKKQFPSEAIQHLSGLQYLEFACLIWLGGSEPPALLSAVFAFSIATSVRTFVLSAFTFESLKELVDHLEKFKHIRSLQLSVTYWIDLDVPGPHEISADFLRGLTDLELSDNMVEDDLIRIIPPTIKTLKLGPRTEYRNTEEGDPDESYEALARCTELESLILETRFNDEIEWFKEALSCAQCPSLRTLSLIYRSDSGKSVQETADRIHLPALDDVLSHEPFLGVQEISVEMVFYTGDQEEADTKAQLMKQYILDGLTRCQNRGVQIHANCRGHELEALRSQNSSQRV